MKQELIAAAEYCFETGVHWSSILVLPNENLFCLLNETFAGSFFSLTEEPKGEDASWFLLLCAEAVDEL